MDWPSKHSLDAGGGAVRKAWWTCAPSSMAGWVSHFSLESAAETD